MENILNNPFTAALLPAAQIANTAKQAATESSTFGENSTPSPMTVTQARTSSNITSIICIALAVYLAVKCKRNGQIDPLQIVMAICCAPCFIAYRVVRPCNF